MQHSAAMFSSLHIEFIMPATSPVVNLLVGTSLLNFAWLYGQYTHLGLGWLFSAPNCAVYVPNKMTNCGHSHLFLFDGRNMISPSRCLRLLSGLVRLYVWMCRLRYFRSDGRSSAQRRDISPHKQSLSYYYLSPQP